MRQLLLYTDKRRQTPQGLGMEQCLDYLNVSQRGARGVTKKLDSAGADSENNLGDSSETVCITST